MAQKFSCNVKLDKINEEAEVSVTPESLDIRTSGGVSRLDYADLKDFRLINYHMFLDKAEGQIEVSMLGLNTEGFFEKLWEAYDQRTLEALFVRGGCLYKTEGDYSYKEDDTAAQSKARILLYPDCMVILPHDSRARRVPLCFAYEPVKEGFTITVKLDTGETYSVSRLGKDTDPFFEMLSKTRNEVVRSRNALEDAPGSEEDCFEGIEGRHIKGRFSAMEDDTDSWQAVIANGRAAVELLLDEQSATYLYEFDDEEAFESSLRHAMEAVGKNREVIYISEEKLPEKPLYRMSVERSRHVRFLRKANRGKLIHSKNWEEQLRKYLFGGE